MKCAWQEFVNILPPWMRQDVMRLGQAGLQELRLRTGSSPQLCTAQGSIWLDRMATCNDLDYVINTASQYSPWTATTIKKGYITAPGGHRIGICGEAVMHNGEMTGIKSPSSLCIRIARDFDGCSKAADRYNESILIIGKPGSGKTTLLRDLIRRRSEQCKGSIAVVDERGELFPVLRGTNCFFPGRCTDIISNCPKSHGIDSVLRTMSPQYIAVDEITHPDDCSTLIQAGWSGVFLLATAHAEDTLDLLKRPVYKPLVQTALFRTVLVMQKDQTFIAERMPIWNSN